MKVFDFQTDRFIDTLKFTTQNFITLIKKDMNITEPLPQTVQYIKIQNVTTGSLKVLLPLFAKLDKLFQNPVKLYLRFIDTKGLENVNNNVFYQLVEQQEHTHHQYSYEQLEFGTKFKNS